MLKVNLRITSVFALLLFLCLSTFHYRPVPSVSPLYCENSFGFITGLEKKPSASLTTWVTPALWETVFSSPDVDRFKGYIEHLASEIGARDFGTVENEEAQEWLIDQFQAVGGSNLTVSRYGTYNNVWAELPGQGAETGNLLLVGAHLDSLNHHLLGRSPGANDDASGIALLLEVARILRYLDLPATIYLIAFNAHYLSPAGNRAFAGAQEVAPAVIASGLTYLLGMDAFRLLWTPSHPRFSAIYNVNGESSYELAAANAMANMSREYGSDTILPVDALYHTSSMPAYYMVDLTVALPNDITFLPGGLVVGQASTGDPYSATPNDIPENYPDQFYENAKEIIGAVCSTLTYLAFMNSSLDYDGDGLQDQEEIELGTFPNSEDTDGDGLDDEEEFRTLHTDPVSTDTDEDGVLDGEEVLEYFTDPLDPDTDGDGLDDFTEIVWLNTSPLNNDTDGDSLTDFQEADGLFVGIDYPGADSEGYIVTIPTKADTDGDGLDDGYELTQSRTNPKDRDTDDDGYTDGEEVDGGSNPLDKEDVPDLKPGNGSNTEDSPGFLTLTVFLPFLLLFVRRFAQSKSRLKVHIMDS